MAGFKIPSPKLTAFVAVVGGLLGLKKYDRYQSDQVRAQLQAQAKVMADEPLDPFDMPSKVVVYLSPPPGDGIHKSRIFFRDYVKPIFDAAALDYDVVESKEPGEIHHTICEEIQRRRRQLIPSAEEDNKDGATPPAVGLSPVRSVDVTTCPKIAVGRNTLVELYNGLSEGCYSSLNTLPEKESTATSEDAKVSPPEAPVASPPASTDVQNSISPAATENDSSIADEKENVLTDPVPSEPPAPTPIVDYDALDTGDLPAIPPIGFVNFQNRIGWTNFPRRILGFFHDTPLVEEIGKQALKIALEQRRPFTQADLSMGIEDDQVHQVEEADKVPLVVDTRLYKQLVVYQRPNPESTPLKSDVSSDLSK
ncbi:mitochondrial import inner membrane translocase subunit tim54 [Dispira parvispora]|uniref:Mitochondrial import inner membrane translocase subunit TIM54 n=1 Tax=Dispira parvispora TaxID=1520584 RepID=A0A9W8EAI1_9FUNG|nr:mitochondrial import inner membrane translocase subunit tim54 [Dispira parvispora]